MNVQRRLAFGMASLTALYAATGQALGLGEVELQSALNQPLQAIIQLRDSEGLSPSDVLVSLADAEMFARVGLERPFFLSDLRFTPVMHDQQLVVRVESSHPVREPYLNFLVQLRRSSGSMLREYTLLFDPPLYQPGTILASAPQQVMPAAERPRTPPQVSAPDHSAVNPQPGTDTYHTVAGDSLWVIANTTRAAAAVSVQWQMDAIRALNPQAFINGDPSRLRVGQQLTLPAAQGEAADAAPAEQPRAPQVAARQPEASGAPPRQSDRLRVDELEVQQLSEEGEQLQQRLNVLEVHFRGLLSELELRDAQIASLQAELDVMRQARDAEQRALAQAAAAAATQERQAAEPEHPATAPSEQGEPTPGAVVAAPAMDQPSTPDDSWISRWWPALLVLVAALLGALLLRSRRETSQASPPDELPRPLPVTVPGSRSVDPLDGVELYLVYGRFPEAKLMLDKAIAAEPQRLDLRLRLLAVLAELGDTQSFAAQERELRALGVPQAQIDRVKASHPGLPATRQSDRVEPVAASAAAGATLDLDEFELEQSWGALAEMDGLGGRRAPAQGLVEEYFESNLRDFPEVGELDAEQAGQLSYPVRDASS